MKQPTLDEFRMPVTVGWEPELEDSHKWRRPERRPVGLSVGWDPEPQNSQKCNLITNSLSVGWEPEL